MADPLILTADQATQATTIATNAIKAMKGNAIDNVGAVIADKVNGFDAVDTTTTPNALTGVVNLVKAISAGTATAVATSAGGGQVGEIFIYDMDVQNGGDSISAKTYDDAPTNSVLVSCTSSSNLVKVGLRSSHPKVLVNGVAATLPWGTGIYQGFVNADVTGTAGAVAVAISGTGGATAGCNILVVSPPNMVSVTFTGGYPTIAAPFSGTQTELKAGDTYQVFWVADKVCNAIEVEDSGAGTSQVIPVTPGYNGTTPITIANRGTATTAYAARIRGRDVTNAWGAFYSTNQSGNSINGTNTVFLNNTQPTCTFGTITYPATQTAVKGTETCTIVINFGSGANQVFWSVPGSPTVACADLDPGTQTLPGATGQTKTFTRKTTGATYNESSNNISMQTCRSANGYKSSIVNAAVRIAAVAPVVTITAPGNPARFRTGGKDTTAAQTYVVTFNSNQALPAAPTMNAAVGGGSFSGSWSGATTTWTRTLTVDENDAALVRATYAWQSVLATNRAGMTTSSVTAQGGTIGPNYTIGGFVPRDVTYTAYSQSTYINTLVMDYTKLQAGTFTCTGVVGTTMTTPGDKSNAANKFTTINDVPGKRCEVWWNDAGMASANTASIKLQALEEIA